MFNNSTKIMFLSSLMLGTVMTISSNSWMGSWLGLEINLLTFIPLMINMKNLMSNEAALKYFLVQAIASSTLLFSLSLYSLQWNSFSYIWTTTINMMIFTSLLLKSGTAPLHFWFPNVMEGLTWFNNLLLMTWQKIAPLILMLYWSPPLLIMTPIMASVIIGSVGGLNQTSLRKIMAFSSINHIGWMLSAMMYSTSLWINYFIFYSILSSIMVFVFHTFNIYHMNQFMSSSLTNNITKFILSMNLLSLGGLPPFIGFYPKWMVIQQLTNSNNIFLMIMLTTFTLITLFFYLRLCFCAFTLNSWHPNWIMKMFLNKSNLYSIYTLSSFSLLGLPMMSSLYILM